MINEPQQQLSEREQAILRLVASGLSNQQIANQLGISINTVKVHLRNVFGKIGAASRTEATLYAVRTGLVAVARDSDVSEVSVDDALIPSLPAVYDAPAATANIADEGYAIPIHQHSVDEKQIDGGAPVGAAVSTPAAAHPRRSRLWLMLIPLMLIAIAGGVLVSGVIDRARSLGAADTVPPIDPNTAMSTGWQLLPSLQAPRAAFATTSLSDYVYLIGGENTDGVLGSVLRFDARAEVWTERSYKPTPVADVRAARIGDRLYVPGGRTSADAADVTDVFERYDPRTERWEALEPLPEPRSGYALAASEGKLYLFGGWDGADYQDSVFVYEPERNKWDTLTPMPTARAFAEAGVVEGNICVIGGENDAGPLANNEMYTPAQEGAQPWSTRAPMPRPRSRFGLATALSLVHVVGGETPDAPPLKYETLTDRWDPFEAAPEAIGSQPGVVMLNTLLVSLGGKQGDDYLDHVQGYRAVFTQAAPVAQ